MELANAVARAVHCPQERVTARIGRLKGDDACPRHKSAAGISGVKLEISSHVPRIINELGTAGGRVGNGNQLRHITSQLIKAPGRRALCSHPADISGDVSMTVDDVVASRAVERLVSRVGMRQNNRRSILPTLGSPTYRRSALSTT